MVVAEEGFYREDNKKKKVVVGDVLELKEEILWKEAEWSVFGCADLVSIKLGFRTALLVQGIFR